MTDHVDGLLSEWLDGTLPPASHARVDEHLLSCGECRAIAEDIRTISLEARALPEIRPERDLWPKVSASLPRASRHQHSGLRLSWSQALAAGIACTLLGAGAMHWRGTPNVSPTAPSPPAMVTAASHADLPTGLAEELDSLERTLATLQGSLSPETAAVLRKNLDLIDRALQESRAALADAPTDPDLREHLQGIAERKAALMRTVVAANSPTVTGP